MPAPAWKEFERDCASHLISAGWTASIVSKPGDQGVDILAHKQGVRVAFQCKHYACPVGNGAVQEAHAGQAFVNAHHAAVISRSGYTLAARALASKIGVRLLSPADLLSIDRLFGVTAPRPQPPVRKLVACRCGVLLNLPGGQKGFVLCPKCDRRLWRFT